MSEAPARCSLLGRVIHTFQAALAALGCAATPVHHEGLGVLVHSCMSDEGRFYHHTEHVFDLS